jgi:hypothetical protein
MVSENSVSDSPAEGRAQERVSSEKIDPVRYEDKGRTETVQCGSDQGKRGNRQEGGIAKY